MYCLNCGRKIELGEKFCRNCGNKTVYNSKDLATLRIIRENKVFGFAVAFDVFLDGDKIGTLKNGTTLEYMIPYGSYELKIGILGSNVFKKVLLLENKNILELIVVPKMGLLAAKPYIKDIQYK